MDHSETKYLPKVDHTPAELDLESRLLLDAAAMIEKDGWARYSYGYINHGPYCIRGSVLFAGARKGLNYQDGAQEALRRLDRSLKVESMGSMAWNDSPERTKDEVVAKLRAVALGL